MPVLQTDPKKNFLQTIILCIENTVLYLKYRALKGYSNKLVQINVTSANYVGVLKCHSYKTIPIIFTWANNDFIAVLK
jgi:hypothetical protein